VAKNGGASRRYKFTPPPEDLRHADRNEWERVMRRIITRHPAMKFTGLTAASYGDPDGTNIRVGTRKLALVTGYNEWTVKDAMVKLRDIGMLWRGFEGSKAGRRGLNDEYCLTIPADIFERVPMLTPDEELPDDDD
jgi:hypothetical protein